MQIADILYCYIFGLLDVGNIAVQFNWHNVCAYQCVCGQFIFAAGAVVKYVLHYFTVVNIVNIRKLNKIFMCIDSALHFFDTC